MLSHLKEVHSRKKYALVIASEGIEVPGEIETEDKLDDFGHIILKKRGVGEQLAGFIEKNIGIETRFAVIGHMQRGGYPTLFDRMLGTRVGVKAAELVNNNDFGKMAALCGNNIVGVPIEEATGKLKTVTEDWINLMEIFFK